MEMNKTTDIDVRKKGAMLKMVFCTTAVIAAGACVAALLLCAEKTCKVCASIETTRGKIDSVKKDLMNGGIKIMKDIHETARNVSDELKGK